ncbi:MAG TPA: hypothetical protein VLK32_01145 [Bacillota bacterium]|nr:hypothetical protein [Bacillota bacterium]
MAVPAWLPPILLLGLMAALVIGLGLSARGWPASPRRVRARLGVIILTEDASAWLEGLVREAYHLTGEAGLALTVVTSGEVGDTPMILERLQRRYPELRVATRGFPDSLLIEEAQREHPASRLLVVRCGGREDWRALLRAIHCLSGMRELQGEENSGER